MTDKAGRSHLPCGRSHLPGNFDLVGPVSVGMAASLLYFRRSFVRSFVRAGERRHLKSLGMAASLLHFVRLSSSFVRSFVRSCERIHLKSRHGCLPVLFCSSFVVVRSSVRQFVRVGEYTSKVSAWLPSCFILFVFRSHSFVRSFARAGERIHLNKTPPDGADFHITCHPCFL